MEQQLLIDSMPIKLTLEEGKDGVKKLMARGEYARHDRPTENNRMYPKKVWERNFKRLSEAISRRRVFGELDHPGDGKTKLQRVSHVTTILKVKPNGAIYGESQILNTPNGRILQALIEAGCEVGVSSRGFGSTKQNEAGQDVVGDDYKLLAFDFVADPADKSAYPKIFSEELVKIPEDDMELTLEKLKADYPGLVEELQNETIQATCPANQEDVNKAVEKAVAEATEKVRKETQEKLKEDFSKKLLTQVEEMRGEITEQVRGELMEDPEVGQAKQILEAIVTSIRPLVIPPDAQDLIRAHDDEISKMKKDSAEKDLEVGKAKAEAEDMAKVAKAATFTLHLERCIWGLPEEQREMIRNLVGDVAKYETVEEINDRIEAIGKELEREAKAEEESQEEQAAREAAVAEKEEEINSLKSENEELREGLVEVKGLMEDLKLQLYVRDKLMGNPHARKLKKVLENASSEDEVDELIEGFQPPEVDDDEMARIRARVGRGQERSLEEDTYGGDALDGNSGVPAGPSDVFGIPMNQLARMSGVPQKQQ